MDVLETMPVSPYARLVRWLLRSWAGLVIAFLYLPIVFLVLFSFEDAKTVGFPWPGFTTRWYDEALSNQQLLSAVWNSVFVAVVATSISTVVGTMAAFGLVRGRIPFPNAARILVTMPIMLPGILIGFAMVVFLGVNGLGAIGVDIRFSLQTVIAGHVVFTMPYVVLIVSSRLAGFDRALEWAAADLGADSLRTLRHIVLPLIAPAILAGALISVTLSIDEFIVTFFLIGPQLTLPIYIYTQIKIGVTPEVNAVATLILVTTLSLLGGGAILATRIQALRRPRRTETA